MTLPDKKVITNWFTELRDLICDAFEKIEIEYKGKINAAKFVRSRWEREGGGGGVMSIMRGEVFEKVGVNVSTVFGALSDEFRTQIPGTSTSPTFFATGISIVAHLKSPLIAAMHFNTRYIETEKQWFGGGIDLTPFYPQQHEIDQFHNALQQVCDLHNPDYYRKFKKQCDEYFYLHHRKEPRGIGGIFYDYLNSGSLNDDFLFAHDVGKFLLSVYPKMVRSKMHLPWSAAQKEYQLVKRGRYVEFNLLYDRGTKFGLMTNGNVEAILMSLPPEVRWP